MLNVSPTFQWLTFHSCQFQRNLMRSSQVNLIANEISSTFQEHLNFLLLREHSAWTYTHSPCLDLTVALHGSICNLFAWSQWKQMLGILIITKTRILENPQHAIYERPGALPTCPRKYLSIRYHLFKLTACSISFSYLRLNFHILLKILGRGTIVWEPVARRCYFLLRLFTSTFLSIVWIPVLVLA